MMLLKNLNSNNFLVALLAILTVFLGSCQERRESILRGSDEYIKTDDGVIVMWRKESSHPSNQYSMDHGPDQIVSVRYKSILVNKIDPNVTAIEVDTRYHWNIGDSEERQRPYFTISGGYLRPFNCASELRGDYFPDRSCIILHKGIALNIANARNGQTDINNKAIFFEGEKLKCAVDFHSFKKWTAKHKSSYEADLWVKRGYIIISLVSEDNIYFMKRRCSTGEINVETKLNYERWKVDIGEGRQIQLSDVIMDVSGSIEIVLIQSFHNSDGKEVGIVYSKNGASAVVYEGSMQSKFKPFFWKGDLNTVVRNIELNEDGTKIVLDALSDPTYSTRKEVEIAIESKR